jgi:ubiquinol-cytochrome c reductase cytochrome c subunit
VTAQQPPAGDDTEGGTPMTDRPSTQQGRRPRTRLRRRVTGALALALALGSVGVAYATVAAAAAPKPQTAAAAAAGAPAAEPLDVRKGRQLYETGCITCHGQNLQGVTNRGPSLIGAGSAAVYFQVATGRMPVARQEAQIPRKKPKYTEAETLQIAAYVQSVGRPATWWATTPTWPRAASCSGSTAPPATTSPAAAAPCRRGSTHRRWPTPTT